MTLIISDSCLNSYRKQVYNTKNQHKVQSADKLEQYSLQGSNGASVVVGKTVKDFGMLTRMPVRKQLG